MDPRPLVASDWQQIAITVNFFWSFAAAVVIAAFSFGFAHAIIPSAVITRHADPRLLRVRPLLYALFTICLIVAAYLIVQGFYSAWLIIRDIYPRWWV